MKTHCWCCGGKLEKVWNEQTKQYEIVSAVWKDEIGNEHTVHKVCGKSLESASKDKSYPEESQRPPKFPPNRERDSTPLVNGDLKFPEE